MRFKAIDSLRGIAATLVVFFHEWNRFYPHATSQSGSFTMPRGLEGHIFFFLFGYGYLGVSLFFVISGFCIHLPQAYRHAAISSDGLALRKFARQRFFRLYPAYFASLVFASFALCVFPALLSLVRHQPVNLLDRADLPSLLINAVFMQQLWPHALEFNGVYWTLLLEVQFYLCYPMLLWVCRRIGFNAPLITLFLAEFVFSFWPTKIPVFILTHYFEWFLGMYLVERLAIQKPVKLPSLTTPLSLLAAICCVFYPLLAPLKWIFAGLASVGLIANCIPGKEESILASEWLVAIGVFSYSLYLFHVPVLDLFWDGTEIARKYVPRLPIQTALLGILCAFAVGYVCFLAFERPYLGAKKKQGNLPAGARERAW